jgi:hypothetical protein
MSPLESGSVGILREAIASLLVFACFK